MVGPESHACKPRIRESDPLTRIYDSSVEKCGPRHWPHLPSESSALIFLRFRSRWAARGKFAKKSSAEIQEMRGSWIGKQLHHGLAAAGSVGLAAAPVIAKYQPLVLGAHRRLLRPDLGWDRRRGWRLRFGRRSCRGDLRRRIRETCRGREC